MQKKLILLACVVVACSNDNTSKQVEVSTQGVTSYLASSRDFPNPERGFYADSYYNERNAPETKVALTPASITQIQANHSAYKITLVHRNYYLPEFIKLTALPSAFIDVVRQDLNAARTAGVKLILRFAYRQVALEDCATTDAQCISDAKNQPDPSKASILAHLENLRDVLTSNNDVIAYVDAGLLGTYGEWAYATNIGAASLLWGFAGALQPDAQYGYQDGTVVNANTQAVIQKYLDVLPGNRAIAIRTPAQRIALLQAYPTASIPAPGLADAYDPRTWNPSQTTVTDATAFQDSNLARLGSHNDCFLASEDDFGTYYYGNYPGVVTSTQIAKEKNYLSANNLYLPMGGETCNSTPSTPAGFSSFAAYAKNELSRMRWSALNSDYNSGTLNKIGATGLAEIKRNLGYRFTLVSSSLPTTVISNGNINLNLVIKNLGYASPYNPRGLEIVFSKTGSAPIRRAVVPTRANNTDPRFWKPGTTTSLNLSVAAPSVAGTYSVALYLPDPLLPNDARYAIRFANDNMYDLSKYSNSEASAAFQALGQSLKVQ